MSVDHPLLRPTPRASRKAAGRRSRRLPVLGLVLGVLLGLCVFAPARWLARAVSASEVVKLEDARGTVWHGSARLWLTGGAGSPDRSVLPQRLHWRLLPGWQGLSLELRADCCTPKPLHLKLSLKEGKPLLILGNGLSDWPADVLVGLGTPWNSLRPAGRMALQTQDLQVHWSQGSWRITGAATLELQDLSSALSTLQPLGSYRLQLAGGPSPIVALETLRGDLLLQGQGSWTGSHLQFRGEARAAPGREDALANFLNIVGKRDGARTLISLG